MDYKIEDFKETLINKNVKPSLARIKVLEYLIKHKSHPTVDEIYGVLLKDNPTLSRTTIYNTLGILVGAGLARVITIEDTETRYDADMESHGHFKCESCGEIFDFPIGIEEFMTENLKNFRISEKNVYFKGICLKCQSNIN